MIRTGIGYDCHRFAAGRRLVLGGLELQSGLGLEGHSDADVLTHAVIDALLGAAALGDIGQHFPDTDPRYAGANSIELLQEVASMLENRGWAVGNVDATVVIEEPKLAPFTERMAANLSDALAIAAEQVNVKATRGEGMGFVGRREGAAVLAVATVRSGQEIGGR
jgi:2-C-methyl-D-erythritol 2,4-cyclodiphosphate synthase